MSALEAPLEALALSYFSFGFLTAMNSVWTWIAVVTTAAFSVWRIRASSPRVKILDDTSTQLTWSPPSSSSPVERIAAEQPVSTPEKASDCSPSNPSVPVFEIEGRTSGKFTLYYHEDEIDYEDDYVNNDGKCGGGAVEIDDRKELHWLDDNLEAMIKVRVGNMGWYTYQDLTVLDGSVVRLWEGCRRRRTAGLMTCGGGGVVTR